MSSLTSAFSPSVLWVVFALIFGAWIVFSWVLRYHWKTYGQHSTATKKASWIYFTISVSAFIGAVLLIISL